LVSGYEIGTLNSLDVGIGSKTKNILGISEIDIVIELVYDFEFGTWN